MLKTSIKVQSWSKLSTQRRDDQYGVDGKGRMRIEATIPARGLIGFRSEF
jgi:predicted membrane GTPase involved in stress response